MVRTLCGISLLLLTWTPQLHAENQLPNQQSALPSLQLNALSATRERPLFAPTRRKSQPPPVAAASNSETQKVQKPQLTLRGIIVSPRQILVLLRNDSTSESVTVRDGDMIGRWHVLVDSNYSVKLKDGAEEMTLEMFAEP